MPARFPAILSPGVILAGGRARRMGGADKAMLPLGGLRLIEHVAARLAPQCEALAVNANGDPERLGFLGLPVFPDGLPDWPGPLAGILAAMDWAAERGAPRVVTAPTDTPFLPVGLVARLAAAGDAAFAASGPAEAPDWHPTIGLWPVSGREALRAALRGGARKVRDWAVNAGAVPVIFGSEPQDPFQNINTPDDLRRAEARLAAGGA